MHTYSVTRENTYEWTGLRDDVFYVKCSCGIASGQTHLTIADAHREPVHTVIGNRRLPVAVWDGIEP
jgi:hypothetical protein